MQETQDIFSIFSEENESKSNVGFYENSVATNSNSYEKRRFVISLGGSLIINENLSFNTAYIAKLSQLLKEKSNVAMFAIVVGGGKIARKYLAAAKSLGLNNFMQDIIGIKVTEINALLIAESIDNAVFVKNYEEARKVFLENKIPVMAGQMPIFTTDAVACLLAELLNAEFINLTNVLGIYNKDPKEFASEARLYKKISYRRLLSLILQSNAESLPGRHFVIDAVACQIMQRSKIKGYVVNGNDLENLANLLDGKEFSGTEITENETLLE